MITKLRNIQNSWFIKGILVLTALSFMSLFGVSGYLGSAGKNQAIIKVDDVVIYQDDINNQYNHEVQMAKNLFGGSLEINDAMKVSLLQGIVQKNLVNAIINKTADDLGVHISDELVKKIIYSQNEFLDENGNFSLEKLRRLLSASGWTEQRYIETLRQDITKQHLVQNPVSNINVPLFMNPYIIQLENQKKVFKYAEIDPSKLKVDRSISQEELEQYYQDFSTSFVHPESRDVSFISLPLEKLVADFTPSDEEIDEYYQQNIDQYVIPEKRDLLQMVFDNENDAVNAMAELNDGKDFYAVAKDLANQNHNDTELTGVTKDTLIEEIGDAVFSLKIGEVAGPIQTDMGWHIMKVADITPMKETKIATVKEQIISAIRKEKAYDEAYKAVAEIEDSIGAGATLKDIANKYNVKISQIKALTDDGKAKTVPASARGLLEDSDFIETAFSYNSGEISQVIEGENDFVIARVDAINDAHAKTLDEVKPEIIKMWEDNEKAAIAQELINDISHDLENGDSVQDVASRFGIPFKTSKPVKHSESFAGLTSLQMEEIFQENIGTPKVIRRDDVQLIIVPSQLIKANENVGKEEMDVLRSKIKADMSQNCADTLINAYGSNYDIRVKYKYLGLTDQQ